MLVEAMGVEPIPAVLSLKIRIFSLENVALLWSEILHIEPHPVP